MAEKVERRLTVIVSADVVAYARLMAGDEAGTRAALHAHRRELIDLKIAAHRGRIVSTAGDSLLIEFESVVEAVQCTTDIQRGMALRNAEVPEDRRIVFRIGINIGDIIVEGDDIHGDGVNVAARLQTLADPGGICAAGVVFDQSKSKVDVGFENLGPQSVKNIPEPVRAYRVLLAPEAAGKVVERNAASKRRGKGRRWVIPAAAAVAIIAIALGVVLTLEPWVERVEAADPAKMAYALPDKPSIAVLPFTNMSEDAEQAFFADGMTDDLITDLSKVSGLFVIARNTTFTYKGQAVKVRQVAEELGVRYVLQGSVRRQGGRVRINAQLIDATGGYHVWAERYDRDAGDIFAIQDEVAGKIVSALEVSLTDAEQATLEQRPTDNLQAYELYLRGLDAYGRFTPDANKEAREWAEKAIAIDPEFALAYQGLGYTYFIEWALGWSEDPASLDRAFEFAQKSLALDPYRPGAHTLISHVYLWQKQIDRALSEAETAVDLSPNDADGYSDLGEVLTWAGRPDEAIEHIKHAMRLNPEHPFFYAWNLGHAYWLAGRLDEAVSVLKEVVAQNPDWMPAHAYLMTSYAELGLNEEVKAEKAELARLLPDSSIEALRGRLPYKNPEHLERFISACRTAGLPEHPPLPLPDKPSIAVLPFTNLSGDEEQEYFVDGMTDTLITDLSRIPELFVIARNTSFTYKGRAVDVKAVGRELGVRYVLEGSVQRAGGRVRINAQLIDAQTGGHVWSDRFDRANEDIFAFQDEAIAKIIAALPIVPTAGQSRPAPTTDLVAYDLYLRGMQAAHRLNQDDLDRAITLFDRAIALDPDFSLAYVGRAWAYAQIWIWGLSRGDWDFISFGPGTPWYEAQKAVGEATLSLGQDVKELVLDAETIDNAGRDPLIASLQAMRARMQALALWKYQTAYDTARYARALAPDSPEVAATQAVMWSNNGEHERALAEMERAYRLDPKPPAHYALDRAMILFHLERFEEAAENARRFQREVADSHFASWILAPALAYLGRLDEARAELAILMRHRPELSLELFDQGSSFYNYLEADEKFIELAPMPMRLRKDRGRRVEGLRLAGAPLMKGGEEPGGERLGKAEITELLTNRTISGSDFLTGAPWWYSQQADGVARRWDDGGNEATGVFTVEDGWACWEWDAADDFKRCNRVYRRPAESAAGADQYLMAGTGCICAFRVEEKIGN